MKKLKRWLSGLLVLCLCISMVPVRVEAAAAGDGTYIWPVDIGYPITKAYTTAHGGFDLGSPIGSAVYAVASGTVIKAQDYGCQGSHGATNGRCALGTNCPAYKADPGSNGSYANWIIIDHGNNVYSLYAHLKTGSFKVAVGQTVQQGQTIAASGNAGNTFGNTGAHLHFELRMGSNSQSKSVDPEAYLTKTNAPSSNLPFGYVDNITTDVNKIIVEGWAADADDFNRAVAIHVWIGDRCVGTGIANQHRQDIQDGQGIGAYHGFRFECDIPAGYTGQQTVNVFAIDEESENNNPLLRAVDVNIPARCYCSPSFGGTYVTTAAVTLHSGHGSQFNSMATIPAGTTITLTKAKGFGANHWGHTTYNGISGYISMEHVHVDLGKDFYAYIILSEPWKHLTNDQPNVSMRTGTGAKNQVWHFIRQNDGSYKIVSVLDGTCMDVQNASTASGANVQTHEDNGSNAQRWLLGGSSGQYIIGTKCAETVLDVTDNNSADGTNIQMHTFTGDPCQRFSIWKLEDYDTTVPPLPKITLSASTTDMLADNYSLGESVTISWHAENSDSYWLQIRNDEDGSYVINERVTYSSYTFKPSALGSYTVSMRAYNEAGDSGKISHTFHVRSVVGDTWVSDSEMGQEGFEFPVGTELYYNYELFDTHTKELLYTFSTMETYVTLWILDPDGNIVETQTFRNDDSDSIRFVCSEPGTYRAQVDLWGGVFYSKFTIVDSKETLAEGYSGDTEWKLTSDGVLTFSGEGAMKNYTYKSEMPWYSYADQITDVVIEEGVISIGSYAFYGMGIESISIPESVTTIGDYAFKNAPKIDNVVLPEGLTSLGDSAFYACTSLTSIEIPASLWTIKPYTFKNCTALAEVTFNEGNLQKISDGAFYGTALTELTLPDCLDILDEYSFKNCVDLESITIGSSLTEIREAVFYGTAIPTIEIPEGITKIGPYAFKNCVELETVDFPSTLTSVGEASFYACTGLKEITLPDAVKTIDNYAFRKCAAIETLKLSAELVTVGECAFYGCTGLTELVIPDKVTTIKPYAFKTCEGLTSVALGNKVANIGEGAFNTCTGLKTIVFPASVETIGDYCFSGSTSLWKLTFEGDAPAIGTGAFKGMDAYAYYPAGNATYTSANMLNYGGSITWTAK